MDSLNRPNILVEIENAGGYQALPELDQVKQWCAAAIQLASYKRAFGGDLSVSIQVVDLDESAALNTEYREKEGPTNVLSFPNNVSELIKVIPELADELLAENSHLGDLIICEPLVRDEAAAQGKSIISHWAHLIIHGALHLQGYDHIDDTEASAMEALEIRVMEQLGFTNPYITNS